MPCREAQFKGLCFSGHFLPFVYKMFLPVTLPQTWDQPFFFNLNTGCAHLLQASVGGRYVSEDDRETVCIHEVNHILKLLPLT